MVLNIYNIYSWYVTTGGRCEHYVYCTDMRVFNPHLDLCVDVNQDPDNCSSSISPCTTNNNDNNNDNINNRYVQAKYPRTIFSAKRENKYIVILYILYSLFHTYISYAIISFVIINIKNI